MSSRADPVLAPVDLGPLFQGAQRHRRAFGDISIMVIRSSLQ
jgi:hypothetical protein